MYGKEFPSHEKFPPRTWCKYPYRKCKTCYHEDPCVPDYEDQYRKKIEDEIGFNEIVGTCLGLLVWFLLLFYVISWLKGF